MKKREKWIACIVISERGIACKDGFFRRSVSFGTPSWTCKLWKSRGWARRFAQRHTNGEYTIKFIYDGDEVDCFGNVKKASHC